jgi:predicted ATPase
VFIAPPWEEIFCSDTERKQTFAESVAIYHNLVKVYTEYGRTLIELPKTSIEDRVEFMLAEIEKSLNRRDF